MDLDRLKIGATVDAPTVSASMATALLAYSGIAVKMLVDQRLGAVLHQMFMVEYEPGGVAQPHDHPFEETYYVLDGEVDASADDEQFTLGPGDLFWTGVGCVHAFHNRSGDRVRFLETQSPQPPANYRTVSTATGTISRTGSTEAHRRPEFRRASYSRASMAAASRSRSMYGSPLTSTATRLIVPPVNSCG